MNSPDLPAAAPYLPQGWPGRLLAIGAPLALAVLFWFGGVQPLRGWYQARQSGLESKAREIERVDRMQSLMPQLRLRIAELRAAGEDRHLLLTGGSDAAAGADLQSALQAAIARADASLASTTMLPARKLGGLRQITAAVQLTANWPGLIALLGQIDRARPRLILSNLTIADAGTPEDIRRNVALRVGFTVSGFRTP